MANAVPVETTCGGRAGSRSSRLQARQPGHYRRSSSAPNSGSRCVISPKRPVEPPRQLCSKRTGIGPTFSASVTVSLCTVSGASIFRTLAVPSVGWPAKLQLFLRGKDAHAHALRPLHRLCPALDERGLGKVELARNGLHPLGRQAARVHHHRQRIARQRLAGENIYNEIIEGRQTVCEPLRDGPSVRSTEARTCGNARSCGSTLPVESAAVRLIRRNFAPLDLQRH